VRSSQSWAGSALSERQIAAFTRRLHQTVRREVPAYAAIDDPDVDDDVREVNRQNVVLFFRCMAERRRPTAGELALLERSARRRLQQAIPLEAIFHSYRVGVRVLWECLLEVAPGQDHGRLAILALEYADRVSTAAARAYLDERQHLAQSRHDAARLLITRIIREEVDEDAARAEGRSLGFDLSRPHVVLVVGNARGELGPTAASDLRLGILRSRLQGAQAGALAVLLSSGLVVVVPAAESNPVEELLQRWLRSDQAPELTAGAGTPGSGVAGLAASYREAVRARALGAILHPGRALHRYHELALFDLFRQGEAMDAFVRAALGPLLEVEARRRQLLVDTLAALFANGLNRKRTAFQLGVHQNTLSNRIRRLERLLGGSLLSGEFCFRIQLALRLLPLTSFRPLVRPPGSGTATPAAPT
jgi:sugar diacid utilization regulator